VNAGGVRRGIVQAGSGSNIKGTTRKDRVRNEVAEGEQNEFAEKIALKLAAKKSRGSADKHEANAAAEKWASVRSAVRAKIPIKGAPPVMPAVPPPPPPRPEEPSGSTMVVSSPTPPTTTTPANGGEANIISGEASGDEADKKVEEKPMWMKLHSHCRWGKVSEIRPPHNICTHEHFFLFLKILLMF
jgi:hypothetical protein